MQNVSKNIKDVEKGSLLKSLMLRKPYLILEAMVEAERGLMFNELEPKEPVTGLEVDPAIWEPWSRLKFHFGRH